MISLSDLATGFVIGIALSFIVNWSLWFWRNAENKKRFSEAVKVLISNGLTASPYIASMGTADLQLRNALDTLAFTGHVVLNREGRIVGTLLPMAIKGPQLRLVVNNTK